jgi:hypothetical protein
MKCRFAVVTAAVAVLGFACTSRAYEYHLQGTLSTGKAATTLGEQFNADGTVSGQVYYYFRSCDRVCGPRYYYCGSGRWDGEGNLISTNLAGDGYYNSPSTHDYAFSNGTTACPINGSVLYDSSSTTPNAFTNNEQVYAVNGSSTTGRDTRGFGYLDTPRSHFTWGSASSCTFYPNGQYCFSPDYVAVPYTPPTSFQITITSDGDFPLNITSTIASVVVSGSYTQGTGTAAVKATGAANDCLSGPVAQGSTCVLGVTFDPSTIKCSASPYSYAYNDLFLALVSDAGNLPKWETIFTVEGAPGCGGGS